MDDLTFRVNFGGDGVAKLRERVRDKLKEYMGDYTDDTLVEYVIVLLKNGRRKQEAKNELNVFLGDDSDSFVSWLWDHLGSNLDLYVQSGVSCPDEAAKTKPMIGDQAKKYVSHLDSEPDREKSNKLPRSRHSREWKGLVRDADEPPPLRSIVTANVNMEEETHRKVGHARQTSPRPAIQRKRNRPDERYQMKREVVSKATIDVPRRLLQFAVRDAVGTPRSSSLTTEPSLKRLRSVVSTLTGESPLEDHTPRIRSAARMPNAMTTAINAVAEAAKDVKNRSSGNVFDRLGRGMDVVDTTDHLEAFRGVSIERIEEHEDFDHVLEETMMESDAGMASDFASDNEGYDDVNLVEHRITGVSQIGTSNGNKGDDSLMVQYSVADNADEIIRKPRKDQDHRHGAVENTSSKIVNISVNVNTWKPSHYQEPKGVSDMDSRKFVQEIEAGTAKSGVRLMKENSNHATVGNGNAIAAADAPRELQKTLPSTPGLYSTGRPTEDADSRTIFVSNVHFAATKDSLSRHFNKFGDVLKVVILTDAATGQPKGSAYVEFMRKEAAENALSLDGTSFMSRILKVVRKSSAPQETAAPNMTWPRIVRGSPFGAVSRFARSPFPRGISSIYRPRLPVKLGARSMQWKRDTQQTLSESGNVPSPTSRSLTYVRTESKTNDNSAPAS